MRRKDKLIGPSAALALAASLLAMTGATTAQTPAPAQALVLEGGTLIDGTGKAPLANAVIVIEGNRIQAVGRAGQVVIPAHAKIVDLKGRTILPGLWDGHTHTQEWQLPMFLHYGITTIADLNNDTAWILAERQALADGKFQGPRLFASGAFLWGPLKPLTAGSFNMPAVRNPAEAHARVIELKQAGVDYIKVDLGLTDETLAAVIAEAKTQGLPLLGHTRNIRKAAEMGFKHEEHTDTMARALTDPEGKVSPLTYPAGAGYIAPPKATTETLVDPKQFPELIKYLVGQGVYLNPTLGSGWVTADPWGWQERAKTAAALANDPQMAFVPKDIRENYWGKSFQAPPPGARGGYDKVQEYIREYAAAGGKITIGTDTGADPDTIPGESVYQEMQMIENAGVPAMKVIQADTLWNAQLLNKDKDLGSVEPGKLADITVIEGDPLKDLSSIKNVRLVIQNGKILDVGYDPKWTNPIPQPYITNFHSVPLEIIKLSTRTAHQGDPALTLELTGNSFAPDSVVRLNNSDLPTKFVSDKKLTAVVSPDFFKERGSYPLYVVNPGPHGTLSPAQYFVVTFKQ